MITRKLVLLTGVFLLSFFLPCYGAGRNELISQTLDNLELVLAFTERPEPQKMSAWDIKLRNRLKENKAPFLKSPPEYLAANSRQKMKANKSCQDNTPRLGNFYISFGYNANHLHYKELEGTETLDEDYGKLSSFYINVGLRAKGTEFADKYGDFFLDAYYRRYDGTITYDGAIIFWDYPLMFKQKQKVHRFGAKIGEYRQFPSGAGEGFAYFDIGQRIWYRGEDDYTTGTIWIDGQPYDYLVDEYAEKYWWTYFGFGAGFNLFVHPRFSLGFEGEFMFSPKSLSKMHANATESFNATTFTLGGVLGWELQLPMRFFVLKNISFDMTPYFTYWHIRRSTPYWVDDLSYWYEPKSNTHIEGVRSGFTIGF